MTEVNELLTTKRAAALTGMSPAWFELRRCKGDGPKFIKVGRAVRYDRAELLAWFREHRRANTSEAA